MARRTSPSHAQMTFRRLFLMEMAMKSYLHIRTCRPINGEEKNCICGFNWSPLGSGKEESSLWCVMCLQTGVGDLLINSGTPTCWAFGEQPRRRDRMSTAVFRGKVFRARFRKVLFDYRQRKRTLEQQYSVIDVLLEKGGGLRSVPAGEAAGGAPRTPPERIVPVCRLGPNCLALMRKSSRF